MTTRSADVACGVRDAFDGLGAARVLGSNNLGRLRGRMPFVVEGGFNAVDVRDVAEGHLLGALYGVSGRRYILGGSPGGSSTRDSLSASTGPAA